MKDIQVYTTLIEKEIMGIRSYLPEGRLSFADEKTRDAVAYGILRISRQIEALARALAWNGHFHERLLLMRFPVKKRLIAFCCN